MARASRPTVSTGKPGKETPTGVFPILEKKKVHHSNIQDSAPMRFMQRLTGDGVAVHAVRIPATRFSFEAEFVNGSTIREIKVTQVQLGASGAGIRRRFC